MRRLLVLLVVMSGVMSGSGVARAEGVATYDAHLTRAPYLTDLVGLHVIVNFATDQTGTAASVAYGSASGGTCTLSSTQSATRKTVTVGSVSEYQWKAALTLPLSGQFCYRPELGTTDLLGAGASPVFTTQAPAGSSAPFSFAVFGDWGLVDSSGMNADQQNLLAQLAASGARFAVTTGDNGYPSGSQSDYGDLKQVGNGMGAIFGANFWPVPGATIPLFTAAGNHGLSGTTHADLTNWPQDQAVSASDGRYQNDVYCCVNGTISANYASSWYAFDAGAARFYVLTSAWGDTNTGTGSVYANDAAAHWSPGMPEYEWLLADLKAHPGGLKFAFSHYPFHTDDGSQGSDTFIGGADKLEGMLATYGVNFAFNGHSHVYQRNRPAAAGYPVTYVTGGGGAVLETIGACSAIDAYGIGWSPNRLLGSACGAAPVPTTASRVFHFLKVTVNGMTVTVAPTDSLGRTFDVQTYQFGSVTPDTVIDAAPTALSNQRSGAFAFHSTVAGATFTCTMDGASSPCTAPREEYANLADGSHTFTVAATAGSATDATPASLTWTIDATAPTAPTSLVATASSLTVALSWAPSSDMGGLAGYDILRDGTVIATTSAARSSYTDSTVAASMTYEYIVRARDTAGNSSASISVSATTKTPDGDPTAPNVVVAAIPDKTTDGGDQLLTDHTPTPVASPVSPPKDGLPPATGAVLGRSATIAAISGEVHVKLPGSSVYLLLSAPSTVPMGTTIDATRGTLRLTTVRDASGKRQTGWFWGGAFTVRQTRGKLTSTVLTLAAPLDCRRSPASTSAGRPQLRKLWGRDGNGRFVTRGRTAVAKVRGAAWFTGDSCAGTLIRIIKGKGSVTDLVRERHVVVTAGHRYLARSDKAPAHRRTR